MHFARGREIMVSFGTDMHSTAGAVERENRANDYANQAVESFEGQITTRLVLDGDTFVINSTGEGKPASGRYVIKKEDADKTPEQQREDSALPNSNIADTQSEVSVTKPTEVLEGEVKDQSSNQRDNFPTTATGGGQQTFIEPSDTNRDEIFGD